MKSPIILGTLLLSSGAIHAATSFGVNLSYNAYTVSGNYSHYGTSTWTNFVGTSPGSGNVYNAASISTTESGVSVAFTASGMYSTGSTGTPNTANEGLNLFYQYLDDNDALVSGWENSVLGVQSGSDGIGPVFQIAGLNQWLASNSASSYSITIILNTNYGATPYFRTLTARSGDLQGTVLGTALGTVEGDGGWDGATDWTGGAAAGGFRGTAVFSDLTADTLTISAPSSGAGRALIAGFVVTSIPEPASALLGGLGLLFLLRRRR